MHTEYGVHNKCMILRTTRTDLKHVLLSGLYALYVRSTSEYWEWESGLLVASAAFSLHPLFSSNKDSSESESGYGDNR